MSYILGIIICGTVASQTNLCVNCQTIPKTIACVAATVILLALGGKRKRTPGVKRKKRSTMYRVKIQSIVIYLG